MGIDGFVYDTRVEFTETDVRSADGRHGPRVAPAVGVEHGERPEVDGLVRYGPIDEGIECDDVD